MPAESEEERIRRLRDAQIRARDPGPSKIKGYDWSAHARRGAQIKKKRQRTLLVDLFDALPARWKGVAGGFVFGLIFMVAAQVFLTGEWRLLGLVGLLISMVVGYIVGTSVQTR
jgi:hypothetical protein